MAKKVTGITRKMETSQELFDLTGKDKMSRADAVKAIWAYATENDLKETKPVKGRNTAGISPDAALAAVFGSKKWHSMGDIAKAISNNLSDE